MPKRVATAAAILFFAAWSIVRVTQPPRPVAATAADTVFSAERAMRHVEAMAARPHAMGSIDHDRVRDYIVAQLTGMGLRTQVQATTAVGTRYQSAGHVQNILAWMPGATAQGKAVLVVTHYDGVAAGPAAGDDAAATAALLETARALRARTAPLAHDVIFLVTDGEEAGLLGAAAFVREHPWAKDVAAIVNFEARGTSGRSLMFETGAGDRAIVSALRHADDVTAGSVFTTVYRLLANDTDLSELAVLGLPALNFAFTRGVERYHTSHDDVAHLDLGSVQHHGMLMLDLVRILANGPLPLPATGDGIFFDLPGLGLVVYPQGLAVPLAVLALVLTGMVAVRSGRGVVIGVVLTVVAAGASAYVAMFAANALVRVQGAMPWGGAAQWRGVTGAAASLLVVATCLALAGVVRRWTTLASLHVGALVVWTLVALALSVRAPGASYLFVWPSLFWAAALLLPDRWLALARWIAAGLTLLVFAGLIHGVAVIMLGVAGGGAMALGALTSLVALLLLPLVVDVTGEATFVGAAWTVGVAIAVAVVGVFTTRRSDAHPVSSALVYAQNFDSTDAWFGSYRQFRDEWTRRAIGETTTLPAWMNRVAGASIVARRVERVPIEWPNATYIRDTIIDGARRVVFRVYGPREASSVRLRVVGQRVSRTAIDARVADTTRYRNRRSEWLMELWAVPDSGTVFALSIPPGQPLDLELVSRVPGLPPIPGVAIPPRPSNVVPVQHGDATYAFRRFRF